VGHRAFLQFPDVVLCNRRSHAQAGRSGPHAGDLDRPEICPRPRAAVLEQSVVAAGIRLPCERRSSAASRAAGTSLGQGDFWMSDR
jgi:hypothetical protein